MELINKIETVRAETHKNFYEQDLDGEMPEIFYSPDQKYFIKTTSYFRKANVVLDAFGRFLKVEIYDNSTGQQIFQFIRNDDMPFHAWLKIENKNYLVLPEDLEGKSFYNLTDREFYSYTDENDPFIWCFFYPSPDNTKLAVTGCYWACPDELKIYDVSHPYQYPFPEVFKPDNYFKSDNGEKCDWISQNEFQVVKATGEIHIIRC